MQTLIESASAPVGFRQPVAWVWVLAALLLVGWASCAWTQLRPVEIASDWHGWRQTDTQTIALNFTKPGANILKPQISWGGDGPGYVETEFQLYTAIVSVLLRVFGPIESAGQLISLLAMLAAACGVFVHLSRRYQPLAALVGLTAFLAARTSPHLATVIMPDALALLAYVGAWTFFSRYADHGRTRDLVMYGIIGTLAMLTKPTMAHIGISSFVLLLLADRSQLRNYRVWVVWVTMVGLLCLYLAHAHQLYIQYGNTFGLLAGEDSKVPHLRYLLMPQLYDATVRYAVMWGLGPVAACALIVQTFRRRLDTEHIALILGNGLIVFIALRYMAEGGGVHYYAPASLLAASGIGSLTHDLLRARSKSRYAGVMVICLLLVVQGYLNMTIRYSYARFYREDPTVTSLESIVATGREIDRLTDSGDLIVARSPKPAFDTFWQQAANYHDPRIFYISSTRGWNVGSEQEDPKGVAEAASRGARFFADPLIKGSPGLDAWLASNADLVWSGGSGARIWKLHPPNPMSR